jgi:hypothetical protein
MNDARERMRKIRDEEQRMNVQGYSANPWMTHQLTNSKGGGTGSGPACPRWPPRNVLIRPEGAGWVVEADGRLFGPAPNATEAENVMRAFYGQAPLRAEVRDWRDDAPPKSKEEV